ncbi:helix-turn-helix domain-containing protein [Saccharopolyspora griseoalba]|uniref:Helix-turn-helix domain-containing protein n=1 Tax=Saccharopolyspora griseoalba TaxID=1431848 RepID=A0ABW2LRZ8_9PSEU
MFSAIRKHLGLSQPSMAERLEVSVDLVKGWETGRRPLTRVSAEDLWRHEHVILAAGAPAELVSVLSEAIRADVILANVPGADDAHVLGPHPLAAIVPGRTLTELLAWPISGVPPRVLRGLVNGERAQLPAGDRKDLAHALAITAESADGNTEQGAMLRRQAAYLAASEPTMAGWTPPMPRRPVAVADSWLPEWPVQRSRAIAAASAGDVDALHQFVDTSLVSEQAKSANLTYWAYWCGEIPHVWRSDAQMVTTPVESWPGDKLLSTLLDGLVHAPYRDLCAHTLNTLLERKPHLVHAHRERLAETLTHSLDANHDGALAPSARDALQQTHYLVRSLR